MGHCCTHYEAFHKNMIQSFYKTMIQLNRASVCVWMG